MMPYPPTTPSQSRNLKISSFKTTAPALLPSWGGLTYELLTTTTLIYANQAGNTMAAGIRLTLDCIGHSYITLGHKVSVCTAYNPSWLGGNNTACLGSGLALPAWE